MGITAAAIIFSALRLLGAPDPIGMLDLRYTLTIDYKDPAQVRMAWDHCHTAATLQGIVNRDAPRLYFIYVNTHGAQGRNLDEYWFAKFRAPHQWLHGRKVVRYASVCSSMKRHSGPVYLVIINIWEHPNICR